VPLVVILRGALLCQRGGALCENLLLRRALKILGFWERPANIFFYEDYKNS